jgi:acetyl esterase/lipase
MRFRWTPMGLLEKFGALAVGATLMIGYAHAQMPDNFKAEFKEMGVVIDPVTTAELYRPLHPRLPYKGVKMVRDQSYGPDPRNVLDVFTPDVGNGPRPVLIFVAGGAGDKIELFPNGDAFYDNIMLWATKQRMTGVSIGRRGAFFGDGNGEDVSLAVQWVHGNIARYGGDANRIFIWGHSAGAMSVADYLSRSQFQNSKGVGVNGAILMAGPYNLTPVEVKPDGGVLLRMGRDAKPTGLPDMPPPDPVLLLKTSNLPGLKALSVPLFLAAAERDPPMLLSRTIILNDELRKAGKKPGFVIYKGHTHLSEVFAVNTEDTSITDPILAWMKTVR